MHSFGLLKTLGHEALIIGGLLALLVIVLVLNATTMRRRGPRKKPYSQTTHQRNVSPRPTYSTSPHRKRVEPKRIGDVGEFKIEVQLRQMPKHWLHLNDLMFVNPKSKTGYSQIDHVLITPHAIFVIETKNYSGMIYGGRMDKMWKVNGYDKKNPLHQNYGHRKTIEELLHEYEVIPMVSLISFTSRAELHVDHDLREVHSDEIVVKDIKLTDYIERKLKLIQKERPEPILREVGIKKIYDLLQERNIKDERIRSIHAERAKNEGQNNNER